MTGRVDLLFGRHAESTVREVGGEAMFENLHS